MIQHTFTVIFEVLVQLFDFLVAVLCFNVPFFPIQNATTTKSEKYGTLLATSVFKVTAE